MHYLTSSPVERFNILNDNQENISAMNKINLEKQKNSIKKEQDYLTTKQTLLDAIKAFNQNFDAFNILWITYQNFILYNNEIYTLTPTLKTIEKDNLYEHFYYIINFQITDKNAINNAIYKLLELKSTILSIIPNIYDELQRGGYINVTKDVLNQLINNSNIIDLFTPIFIKHNTVFFINLNNFLNINDTIFTNINAKHFYPLTEEFISLEKNIFNITFDSEDIEIFKKFCKQNYFSKFKHKTNSTFVISVYKNLNYKNICINPIESTYEINYNKKKKLFSIKNKYIEKPTLFNCNIDVAKKDIITSSKEKESFMRLIKNIINNNIKNFINLSLMFYTNNANFEKPITYLIKIRNFDNNTEIYNFLYSFFNNKLILSNCTDYIYNFTEVKRFLLNDSLRCHKNSVIINISEQTEHLSSTITNFLQSDMLKLKDKLQDINFKNNWDKILLSSDEYFLEDLKIKLEKNNIKTIDIDLSTFSDFNTLKIFLNKNNIYFKTFLILLGYLSSFETKIDVKAKEIKSIATTFFDKYIEVSDNKDWFYGEKIYNYFKQYLTAEEIEEKMGNKTFYKLLEETFSKNDNVSVISKYHTKDSVTNKDTVAKAFLGLNFKESTFLKYLNEKNNQIDELSDNTEDEFDIYFKNVENKIDTLLSEIFNN